MLMYKLGFIDNLKLFFNPFQWESLLLLTVIILASGSTAAIAAFIIYKARSGRMELHKIFVILLIGLSILPIAIALGISLPSAGYQIEDSNLKLKAPLASALIPIPQAQVALVDSDSQWKPIKRIAGVGMAELLTGMFRLMNGKTATVFYHKRPKQMVVLLFDGRYYLLAHPGVEELYHTLLALTSTTLPS